MAAATGNQREPEWLPVICEKMPGTKGPDVAHSKFTVPAAKTVGGFANTVRQQAGLGPHDPLVLFLGDMVLPEDQPMGPLYAEHKGADLFMRLYFTSSAPL